MSLVLVSPLASGTSGCRSEEASAQSPFHSTIINFQILKVWAKKNGQLVRGTKAELVRCNLSYFIFPTMRSSFIRRASKGRKKPERPKRELELENFILQGL